MSPKNTKFIKFVWPEGMKEEAVRLYATGLSSRDVAQKIGLKDHKRVQDAAREAGIIRNRSESIKISISAQHARKEVNRQRKIKTYVSLPCTYCGSIVEKPQSDYDGNNIFCDLECYWEWMKTEEHTGENHPLWRRITLKCDWCGKDVTLKKSHVDYRTQYISCSRKCKDKLQSKLIRGENHPNWLGGISFLPYCYKFDKNLRERVRSFWGHKCALCGKPQDQEGVRLHVHHVNYNKDACCNPDTPWMFVPLCASCHGKTSWAGEELRKEYINIFTNLILSEHDGRSYYTKQEYTDLQERGEI